LGTAPTPKRHPGATPYSPQGNRGARTPRPNSRHRRGWLAASPAGTPERNRRRENPRPQSQPNGTPEGRAFRPHQPRAGTHTPVPPHRPPRLVGGHMKPNPTQPRPPQDSSDLPPPGPPRGRAAAAPTPVSTIARRLKTRTEQERGTRRVSHHSEGYRTRMRVPERKTKRKIIYQRNNFSLTTPVRGRAQPHPIFSIRANQGAPAQSITHTDRIVTGKQRPEEPAGAVTRPRAAPRHPTAYDAFLRAGAGQVHRDL